MKKYHSVWDAIEASSANAANMKVRAELMIALQKRVENQPGSRLRKPRASASISQG